MNSNKTQNRARHAFILILALAGFISAVASMMVTTRRASAQATATWSVPVNLAAAINSSSSEQQPAVSPNGLSLYFASNRTTGSLGGFDLYVSQRASVADPWGAPVNLGPALNTSSDEGNAAFSRDGRLLFFQSKRPGGLGGVDIWLARRDDPFDDFNWQPPVDLSAAVNSTADDTGPAYFEDIARGTRQLYFGSTRSGGLGGADIYVSEQMAGGSFGAATLVMELNSTTNENDPSIRYDGLEIFFQSNRAGAISGSNDLWVATRQNTLAPWSAPVSLDNMINTASAEQNAYLSSDGTTLFFSSDRLGGSGGIDLYVSARAVANPRWTITGNLNTSRSDHTATLLPSGKVLIAGGYIEEDFGLAIRNSAELYDPATGIWTNTGNLNLGRYGHSATLLFNGKVLVAGGSNATSYVTNSAELYDPATGTWSNTGNLNTARRGQTATLLSNGKVLVAGGEVNNLGNNTKTAEVYDPATETWTNTGNLNTIRADHTATLLPNGRVLVVGGDDDRRILESAELYNADLQTWSVTGNLNTVRSNHTATLLPDGKVLVAGAGWDTAELFDPSTETWSSTGNLNLPSDGHTATLLPNGKVLIVGGDFVDGKRAELYDPITGTWNTTANPNSSHQVSHTATLLLNGKVLVAGGSGSTTELYDSDISLTPNPIDDAQFFVRQHYLDFLNREPDSGGLAYWTNEIANCGSAARCILERRIGVSGAFFVEMEFQDTGYYVYRFYKASFGRQPNHTEFTVDRSKVIGGSNLEANKQAFADEWIQRPAFVAAYPGTMSNTEVVNKLFDSAGLHASLYDAQRQHEIQNLSAGASRALVLRDIIEIPDFKNPPAPTDPRYAELKQISQYNSAFVLMQYFGYLRRDVDQGGYDFWLDVVNNREPNNYRGMVCAFITSAEYQLRFGSVVTRSNADCGQ